jgi:NAD(P)-dependent dehydrogenase (short-subunit alcohol dehydrogenase family)
LSGVSGVRGPVLVTGAGSGIGLAIVQALRAAGVTVFAGARRPEHLRLLQDLGATAVPLDVRDAAQVHAAAAQVQAAGQGLHGLVHNAGVGGIGLLPSWPDADVQALFDTNVFGPHRLTNALLPLLLASRGRIVCIGSQGGSVTMPFMGPYTMSKHALEAYAACLRMELAPQGVAVSIVQPGAVKTDIGDNGRAGNVARLQATPPPFDGVAQAALHGLQNPMPLRPEAPESANNRRHAEPAAVAATVLQALGDADPQARYLFGTRWEGDRVIAALTERLLDAARSPSHQWDEETFLAHCRQAWQAGR